MSQSTHSIASLFAPEALEAAWTGEELSSIWKHQLRSPLGEGFSAASASAGANPGSAIEPCATFGGLLHGPNPSVEGLTAIKVFAKSILTQHHDLLPTEIATALYYLSILAARTRLNERISQLDDIALQHGIHWLNHQAWLDDSSRQLSTDAAANLSR